MVIGATKEEEEALRDAAINGATGVPNSNSQNTIGSRQSIAESQSTGTTGYESARSYQSEEEQEQEQEQDTTANAETQSFSTIQDNNNNSEQSVTDEEVSFNPDDGYAADPISLERTKSIMSLARSHKSFDLDDGLYGVPQPQDLNYQNQSESYHLALTRTISRKSISRKTLKDDAEKAILEGEEEEEEEHEEEIDPATLDWDSPDDKENPQNWSHTKKWIITMITASICLVVSLGSSLFVCGVTDLVVEFKISETLAISGLTFYLIGLAFGPVLAAPMSEVLGRRIVYISSLPISMLFTMGVGLSKNIGSVLVLRFFSGFFASPAMAVAGGTIADIWDMENMGLAMAGFCLAPFMGPVLGPIIGGFVAEKKGWKWTLWVQIMFAGAILLPVFATPETYKPILLKKRAKKRGLKLAKPKGSPLELLKVIFTITLMTPVKMLFLEPIVMVFSIYIAFVFAVLFGFFEAYPIIFEGVYGMSLGITGLCFLGVMIGFILGTAAYVLIDRLYFFPKNPDGTRGKRDQNGNLVIPAPESRLILCKIGSIALPCSLFWLGWTSRTNVHWISAIIAGVPFGFGLILIFFATMIYFSMSYPPLSLASALAANNFFRYLLASVFPLFIVQMYRKLQIDWATSLFAFIALAMVPVPWIFEKWGPVLRKQSVYGFAAMFRQAQEENERLQKLQSEVEEEVLGEQLSKVNTNLSSNNNNNNESSSSNDDIDYKNENVEKV